MGSKLKTTRNAVASLVKGLRVTLTNLRRTKTTVKYPEVLPQPAGRAKLDGDDPFARPYELAPRYRGLHGLTKDPETGDLNCIGCMACAKVCPDDLISMDLEKREGHNGRYPVTFTVNIGPCCFCGLCAEVCPTPMRAIVMTDQFEWATYRRDGANLVLNRDDLIRHGEIEVARRRAGREWAEDGRLLSVLPEEEGNPYFQYAAEYEAARQGKSLAEVQAQPSRMDKEKKAKEPVAESASEPAAPAEPGADPLAALPAVFAAAGLPVPEDLAGFDLTIFDAIEDRKQRAQLKSAVMKARKALEAGAAQVAEPAPEPAPEAAPAEDPVEALRTALTAILEQAGLAVPDQLESLTLEAFDALEDRKLKAQGKSTLRKLHKALGLVE